MPTSHSHVVCEGAAPTAAGGNPGTFSAVPPVRRWPSRQPRSGPFV